VFVLVLIGLAGLVRALQWYFDPFRELDRASAIAASTRPPSPTSSRGRQSRTRPPATSQELALLDAPDTSLQIKAAETLLARAVTPELVTAVDATLRTRPDPHVEALLVCIKSRFEGPGTLGYLLTRFPSTRHEFERRLSVDVSCLLDALVERISEDPERVTAALLPAIYSNNATARHKVIQAFRLVDLPSLPAELAALGRQPGEPLHKGAVAAAMALGALRYDSALVDRAVREPGLFAVVAEDLRSNPHPNGARVLAGVWTDQPGDTSYAQLARAREGLLHDVSAALVEIVRSATAPEPRRVAAARHLGTLGEVGALRDLNVFSETVGRGDLKTAIDAAIRELQERRRTGARDQMRSLPQ
jgi:hypothetical protein